MALSLDEAARVFRTAVLESIRKSSLLYIVQGVLLVAAGIFALLYPLFASAALAAIIGWLLIVSGVIQGIGLVGARHAPHFALQLLSVAIGILLGVLLLLDPAQAVGLLSVLLIVFLLLGGGAKIMFALTVRPESGWGWVLAGGLASLVLAVYMIVRFPVAAGWVLGLFLGISLIAEGASIAFLAWLIRRHVPKA